MTYAVKVIIRFVFRIGADFPFVDEDGTAAHGFPADGRGIYVGVNGKTVLLDIDGTIGAEGFPTGRTAHLDTVVFNKRLGREGTHIEIAAVDACYGAVAQAQGAGAIGLFALAAKDVDSVGVRTHTHKTDGLRLAEKIRL